MSIDQYQPSNTVLCFENFKENALYFDRLLPLNMGRMRGDPDVGDILVGFPEEIPSAALSHLIDGVEGDTNTYSHATRVIDLVGEKWGEFAKKVSPYANLWCPDPSDSLGWDVLDQYRKLQNAYCSDASSRGALPIRTTFREYALSVGFERFCVSLPASLQGLHSQCDPSITLSRLSLIDARQADWRQIIEVRKDIQSHRKLARLRLFMHNNYSECSFAYIEDDLCRRLEEYDQVRRKFGFKTTVSSLSMLLDAKALPTSVGAGLVAGLFGGTTLGLAAAAAIEIGKIAINFVEKHHEMKAWQAGHELAYILETKSKLS
ncbi:hypothetical protein [Paraburkholderia sp. BCC1876]|uniref:hypothetical protein n=1 Tax=Paraburkholderia sp. BCC1876 TaxID=2676303 RepID=UPI00158FFE5D|nr:hypothetical protein [Paraburkholderia sp. BCC1876]